MTIATCLYLVEVISNMDCIFSLTLFISIIIMLVAAAAWLFTLDSYFDSEHARITTGIKVASRKWWAFALLLLINIAIPSKNTMYLMLGSSYLSTSNLPNKVSQALELKLDDVIDQLKHKDKKKD